MRFWSRLWWWFLMLGAAWPAAAEAPNLLPGDTSFEVGGSGFHLRTGWAGPRSDAAALVDSTAAEGQWSVRLTAGVGDVALESGWVQLEPGQPHTFSALVRADRVGMPVAFDLVPVDGVPETITFHVTPDWRSYAAPLTPRGAGWYRFQIRPDAAAHGSLWVDGLQLERGDATAYEPAPALGARLTSTRSLRRAGESTGFDVLLRWPGGGEVPLEWRVEDPFGAVLHRGAETVTVPADEPAEVAVKLSSLPPGAWRLVAEAELGGRRWRTAVAVVAVTQDLGDPETWCGVSQPFGRSGQTGVDLLRLGRQRGMIAGGPAERWDSGLPHRLRVQQRAGVDSWGWLPPWSGDPAAAAQAAATRVRQVGDLLQGWEPPPGVEQLPAAEYVARLQAVRAATLAARRQTWLLGLRVDSERAPAPLAWFAEAVQAGGLLATDGVALRLGQAPPELAGGRGVTALVDDLRRQMRAASVVRPLWVIADGWPARPWAADWATAPLGPGAAERFGPLEQAVFLARALLLARAAGVQGFLCGAPLADRPAALTVGAAGLTSDLFAFDGSPQPAAAALDQALDSIRERRLGESVPLGPGVVCQRWIGRRPLTTVWQWGHPGERYRLELPLPPARIRVCDVFGRPVPVRGDTHRSWLPVGEQPLYIEARDVSHLAYAAAWRAARLTGYPPLTAAIVPVPGGCAVLVHNATGRTLAGVVRAAGRELPFGPLAAGAGQTVALPLPAPPAAHDAALRAEVVCEGTTVVAATSGRRVVARPVGSPAEWLALGRLLRGVAVTPQDFSARFQTAWDATALELRIDLVDDLVTADDQVDVRVEPRVGQPGAEPLRFVVRSLDGGVLQGGDRLGAGDVELTVGADRRTLRLRWPWAKLGVTPGPGTTVGLEVSAVDHDAPARPESRWGWCGGGPEAGKLGWIELGETGLGDTP